MDDPNGFINNLLAVTPTDSQIMLDGLSALFEFDDQYRGGNELEQPAQSTMPVEPETNCFPTFSGADFPGNASGPNDLQSSLLKAEKEFQALVQTDPLLQLIRPKPDVEDEYRGEFGASGCEVIRPADDPDVPSTFQVYEPFKPSVHSSSPEPRNLPAPDETDINEPEENLKSFHVQDMNVRPYSQTTGGSMCVPVQRLETDSTIRCLSAPGRFDGMSKPDRCVLSPRPASMESNLSAMAVDDQTASIYPVSFSAHTSVAMGQCSAKIDDQPFVSATQQQSRDEQIQNARLAIINAPIPQQQPQGPSSQHAQYGNHPCLKVINQPQHEQTVLYQSDSANRGVLKDREGKGFPAVMVCDYQGPAEIYVYAATSTGQPHPFFFVQCVEGVGQCYQCQDRTGLHFVRTAVDSKTGMRAIFPKLSVKRYKEKEVKQDFAQWHEEKGLVCLHFIAVLANGVSLDTMSGNIIMTKKAEMQKRREQGKAQPATEPMSSGAMAAQASVAQPMIRRVIGNRGSHAGGDEICLYGNNFSSDCIVIFLFSGIHQQPVHVQANKCTEQMACTNTHLLVQVPPSPLSAFPLYRRQQVGARIFVVNPTTCAQSADSDCNEFIYCD